MCTFLRYEKVEEIKKQLEVKQEDRDRLYIVRYSEQIPAVLPNTCLFFQSGVFVLCCLNRNRPHGRADEDCQELEKLKATTIEMLWDKDLEARAGQVAGDFGMIVSDSVEMEHQGQANKINKPRQTCLGIFGYCLSFHPPKENKPENTSAFSDLHSLPAEPLQLV